MTYPRLSVEDFGRALITTGDLDPVYIALTKVEWPEQQRKRWLVAYWLFYHPGSACYLSERPDFWAVVSLAAENNSLNPPPVGERWPRASERRHFRGDKAILAVEQLTRRFPGTPELLVDFISHVAPNYQTLFNRVCSLPQFGNWIAFKIADMLERCMDTPVDFDLKSVTMFDDPRKAALLVWRQKLGLPETARPRKPDDAIQGVVEYLIKEFSDQTAPPNHDRPVGYQEAETVLCKYKSHINGHYPVGNDIAEIRGGLTAWSEVSESAKEFLWAMPAPVE